ncbi:GTP cyclohydrolase II [Rhodobacterales bacterium HKCCE3408]|nr:GTP cyclohydrolase II [Rhodobacterales bacterium HKCCE3408]
MTLAPSSADLVARARGDLRLGLGVVIAGAGGGLLAVAAEVLTAERLAAIRALPGAPVVAITTWRAETLKARAYDGDIARVVLPESADVGWIHCVADPARDLMAPMKGPLTTLRDGDADLHRLAVRLVKSAELLPAALCLPLDDPARFASETGLTLLSAETAAADLALSHRLSPVSAARLPMAASEAGRLRVFRPENGGIEHYAIEIGRPDREKPVLTRLHSACFTGDVLGSLKCDCGPQLHTALARMGEEGAGILLYLNQEGRGIGLANKMRAYALQDQGFDTVEANHRLGFEDDERDFRLGAALLRQMGVGAVRLMTNNPRKVEMMEAEGIAVAERVPLVTGTTRQNAHYLATKKSKSGHLL